jgi:transketolase
MRLLPGMEVMQPGSKKEFDVLFSRSYNNGLPSYLRIAADEHGLDLPVEFGKGVVIKETPGAKVSVLTAGPLLGNVHKGCADLPVNLIYFHTLKPLDLQLLSRFVDTKFVVIHDAFGLFEALTAACAVKAEYHGLPDEFCCYYGTLEEIRKQLGLDPAGIHTRIQDAL